MILDLDLQVGKKKTTPLCLSRLCLIDTGSEVSIVPSSDVEGLELQPSTRVLLAVNGTSIRLLGEITVLLKLVGDVLPFWYQTRLLSAC